MMRHTFYVANFKNSFIHVNCIHVKDVHVGFGLLPIILLTFLENKNSKKDIKMLLHKSLSCEPEMLQNYGKLKLVQHLNISSS